MTSTPPTRSTLGSDDGCRDQISPVLEVKSLRKTYGKLVAVSDVSFAVYPQQVFCLVGPNGAGKTSIIDCVVGLKKPDLGDVFLFGELAHNLLRRKDLLRRIGIQFQEDSLYADIRVNEALRLYASMYENPVDPGELLNVFELQRQQKTAYKDLSGGERRRLLIAIALVGNPALLILDEPASNLDPHLRRELWEILDQYRRQGLTIVMTTHNMQEAQQQSDVICVMNSGRIIASGSVQQLLERFQLDLKVEINAEVSPEALEDCPGVTHVDLSSRRTCVYGNGEGFEESVVKRVRDLGVKQFAVRSADLEDVYLLATGRRYMRYSHGHLEKKQGSDSLLIQGKDLLQAGINESDIDKIYEAQKLFERVRQNGEHEAFALYYLGLSEYRLATLFNAQSNDKTTRLACIDRAIDHLKKAIELEDSFSDAHALLASVYGHKIGLKPHLGMVLGPQAKSVLEKAKRIEGDNPRVVFLDGMSDYHTPPMWGGDRQRAIEKLERVAELFSKQEVGDPRLPSWGHDEVYAWLGIIRQGEDDVDGAREAFAKALEVNPDNGWVRDVLLPGLDGG